MPVCRKNKYQHMKSASLMLLLVCVAWMTRGQSYNPLVDSGKVWSTRFVIEQTWTYSDYKKFEGDTSISGISYKKIWVARDPAMAAWTRNGFIRETTSRQVFYKSSVDFPETLIYDFSLQPGDSARFWGDQSFYYKLDSITTTTLLTGEHRRQFHLSAPLFNCTDHWIEGIGSLFGVLEPASCFWVGGTSGLLCFTEHDSLKYHDPGFSACYVNTGIRDQMPVGKFIVIHDRKSGKLIVTAKEPPYNDRVIELFDIYGRRWYSGVLKNEKTEISLAGLNRFNGLVLVRIRSGNIPVFSTKMILFTE